MYVKNVSLNGDLREEAYMIPPPSVFHNPRERCNTLKYASRAWLEKLSIVIVSLEFYSSDYNLLYLLILLLMILLFFIYMLMT